MINRGTISSLFTIFVLIYWNIANNTAANSAIDVVFIYVYSSVYKTPVYNAMCYFFHHLYALLSRVSLQDAFLSF